jgi:hypothetical protein
MLNSPMVQLILTVHNHQLLLLVFVHLKTTAWWQNLSTKIFPLMVYVLVVMESFTRFARQCFMSFQEAFVCTVSIAPKLYIVNMIRQKIFISEKCALPENTADRLRLSWMVLVSYASVHSTSFVLQQHLVQVIRICAIAVHIAQVALLIHTNRVRTISTWKTPKFQLK